MSDTLAKGPSRPRVWFHVDVNSAFLSWSAVLRLREGGPDTQDLRTVPAAVGGDEEKRHGVVLAKSLPAKQHGVRTGESLFAARQKCPGLIVIPPNFDWYVQCSKAMFNIFSDFTPDIEQYSIDEAFLDMTGTEELFGPPEAAAAALRRRVREELGFTVNVGIAPNRLLAKMASDFEKPDRTHTLYPPEIPAKLWPLPVRDLFGVGPSAAKRMNELRIFTIGDLAAADPDLLLRVFGARGDVYWDYANGRETAPMVRDTVKDSSYGNSVTTAQDLHRPEQADATLLALCESVGARLRADGKAARVVTVQLVDAAFRRQSHQTTLPSPTNATETLYRTARELMRAIWPRLGVRLVGVTAEKTGTERFEQLDLFTDARRSEKQEALDRAADELRRRFGDTAVLRAKLLEPETRGPGALGAAKERDKRKNPKREEK